MTVIKSKNAASDESLGDRMRFARELRGLARAEVSMLLGVSERTFEGWEADKAQPRANRMPIIAGTLNVHLRWLMSGEGDLDDQGGERKACREQNRDLPDEIRSIKESTIGAADRLAELETRLRVLASRTGADESLKF